MKIKNIRKPVFYPAIDYRVYITGYRLQNNHGVEIS